MPLQERSPEFEKALQALQDNIESIDLPTKQSHTFYSTKIKSDRKILDAINQESIQIMH